MVPTELPAWLHPRLQKQSPWRMTLFFDCKSYFEDVTFLQVFSFNEHVSILVEARSLDEERTGKKFVPIHSSMTMYVCLLVIQESFIVLKVTFTAFPFTFYFQINLNSR